MHNTRQDTKQVTSACLKSRIFCADCITCIIIRLTSRHRNHHSLLLLGLTPSSAGAAGAGDNSALTSTLATCGAHHKRTRVHSLLQEPQHKYMLGKSNKTKKNQIQFERRLVTLTMPEPLQWLQCWTLVPGSLPLPSQRWQVASILMDISLLIPFAAWVNVSSIMYWIKAETEKCVKTWIFTDANWSNLLGGMKRNYVTTSHLALTDLPWLIKHGVEVSEATASRKLAKDFAEELLWIHVASLPAPVLLPAAGLTCVKARSSVHVVLFPLAFVTEDLWGKKRHLKQNAVKA